MHPSKENSNVPRFYTKEIVSNKEKPKVRESKDFQFFGVTKTKSGDAPISIAFKIILKDGSQYFINYHEIYSPMIFSGNSQIELRTPTTSITIEGNNLEDLFDYLGDHRVVWLKEPDSEFVQVKEGDIEIQKINLDYKNQ